jgi:hypothetical protein
MVHAAAVMGPMHRAREPRSMAGPWVLPVFNGAGARLHNESCNRDFQIDIMCTIIVYNFSPRIDLLRFTVPTTHRWKQEKIPQAGSEPVFEFRT